jgi:MSHA pilin protein MshC
MRMKSILGRSSKRKTGFTLVELVVVIVLISILSVTVFSRFSGTSGFSEYTYQARLISVLRNMQTRAMHDTRDEYCFQINLYSDAFGPPALSYTTGSASDTCQTNIDFDNPAYLSTSATEMADAGVSLLTEPNLNFIAFNSLGQPVDGAGLLACDSENNKVCKITITGEKAVSVCIESEGYIRAC